MMSDAVVTAASEMSFMTKCRTFYSVFSTVFLLCVSCCLLLV